MFSRDEQRHRSFALQAEHPQVIDTMNVIGVEMGDEDPVNAIDARFE